MAAGIQIISKTLNKIRALIISFSLFPINKKKMCIRLLLIILIILGGVLRLYDLSSRPFLTDEGISTMVAIDIYETGYPPIPPGGGEYWRSVFPTSTMAIFFQFFGVSVFVARLPSVIIGTMSIILIYFFGKALVNWKVGLIAAFLLSINVLAIDLSREARMYAFFQFFYLLSLYFFYMGFEAKEGKTIHIFKERIKLENIKPLFLLISFAAILISFLCHQGSAMIFLGLMGYAIIMGFNEYKGTHGLQRYINKYSIFLFLVIVLGVVGFLVVNSTDHGHEIIPTISVLHFDLKASLSAIKVYGVYILQNFPIEFCFATLGIVTFLYNRKKNLTFIIASLLIPLLFQVLFFHSDWLTAKYLIHLIPLFIILSAYGIYEMMNQLKILEQLKVPNHFKPRFFVIVLSLFLIFAGFSYALLATQRGKIASPYWREACEYVLINSKNDTVLVTSVGIIPYFFLESDDYGLRPDYPEYAHKNITIYDRPYLHTRADLENMTRTHDNGWVLVDMDRWNWEAVITEDAKLYLQENMTWHPYKYHMYLIMYSWGYD